MVNNEIKKLQKIAGILKEDAFETQKEQLPENWVLIFNYSDGQVTPSTSGRSAEQVAAKIKEGDIKQGFPEEDIKFTKNANDFYTVELNEYHMTDVIGSKAPNSEKIKELYELGVANDDYDIWQTAFDILESMKKSKTKIPKFSLDAFSLNEDD